MASTTSPSAATAPSAAAAVADVALRVAGGLVAVALAAITAVVEILYSPLRVGGVLIGVSALIAVVVNYWLLRYTVRVTGVGWAGLVPPLVWFGAMLVASDRTTEGDVLLAGDNWVGLLTIFGGSLSFAVSAYRLILAPKPVSSL